MGKFSETINLCKLLRIDVYVFLFIFAYGAQQVPTIQLIQDKVCIGELNQTAELCHSLEHESRPELESIRTIVLERATAIRNYQTIISTFPGVFQALFIGYWIDKYPSHIRFLTTLPCFGILIQSLTMAYQCAHFEISPIYSIWSFLFMGLGGNLSLVLALSFTYAARKTPQKYRSIRFAIIDLFIFTGMPVAIAAGGKILAAAPWFSVEKRNFIGVYLSCAISVVLGIIWTLIFVDDTGNDTETEVKSSVSHKKSGNIDGMDEIDLKDEPQVLSPVDSKPKAKGCCAIASDILNPVNIIATFKTFLRPRPNQGRFKVILIAFSVFISFISLIAESLFGFQFTEKAFHWDYKYYSNISALLQLSQSFGTIAGAAFLKNVLNFRDSGVVIVGLLSHIFGNVLRGLNSRETYIAGSLVFFLGGIVLPASRSCVTQVIEFNEIGQILTMISSFQAIGPVAASILTTEVFEATLNTLPGMTYHVLALICLLPLLSFIWINMAQVKLDAKLEGQSSVTFNTENVKSGATVEILKNEPKQIAKF